jgi:hypothetical protein
MPLLNIKNLTPLVRLKRKKFKEKYENYVINHTIKKYLIMSLAQASAHTGVVWLE